MSKLGYLGIDQYGDRYKMDKHPRKELLDQLDRSHADLIYRDRKSGPPRVVGYVIAGLWIDVYEVHEWVRGNQ